MASSEDLDKEIEAVLASLKKSPKTPVKPTGEKWYVWYIKQAYPKPALPDFQKRHIYNPTSLPTANENEMVVLHKHPPWETCRSKYECHELHHPEISKSITWKDLYDENYNSALRFS